VFLFLPAADRIRKTGTRALSAALYTNPVITMFCPRCASVHLEMVSHWWSAHVLLTDWRGYRYRVQYTDRNRNIRDIALGHWRRTVWAALHTTPLPSDVVVAHVLPRLHADPDSDELLFAGQLDLARAASVLGIQLPDSDDTASDASSVCKDNPSDAVDSDFEDYPPSEWTASSNSSSDGEQDDPAEEGDASGNESADATSPNAKRVKEGE
jgi:hypothetical protein